MESHVPHSHYPVWIATIEANVPRGEDRYLVHMQEHIVSVMDGHGGSLVVDFIEKHLVETLKTQLEATNGNVAQALIDTYRMLDEQMLKELDMNEKSMYSGTCINTLYVDTKDNRMYIANLGDCRSVVGKRRQLSEAAQYDAFPLSVDHNCYNPEEKKKTIARSGDRNAIRCSPQDIRAGNSRAIPRVAGYLAVTRSLGDFYLKEQHLAKKAQLRYFPYLTCEPDITVHTIDLGMDFIVMASDGLWEHMNSQEVVDFLAPIVDDLLKKIFEDSPDIPDPDSENTNDSIEDLVSNSELILQAIQSPPVAISYEQGRRLIQSLNIEPLMQEIKTPACTPMAVSTEPSESSFSATSSAPSSVASTSPELQRNRPHASGGSQSEADSLPDKLSSSGVNTAGVHADAAPFSPPLSPSPANTSVQLPTRLPRRLRPNVDATTLPNPSALLLEEVLRRIAQKSHSTVAMLKSLPPGARRYLFDDITIVVLLIA